MSARRGVLGTCALVVGLSGCGGGGRAARPAGDSVAAVVSPAGAADTARPAPQRSATDTSAARAQDAPPAEGPRLSAKADSLPLVTIADLVAANTPVGSRVRVRGTCIGYSRVVAIGPQPRTRSDWQLTTDSVAIWVVGPYPAGCSGTIPAPTPSTVIVEVAEDTLPALGARPPRARRYLVRARH